MTSAIGKAESARDTGRSGFSLVELLVVLVLVALIGTVTILTLPPRAGQRGDGPARFALAANRAQQAAILTGNRHGLALSESGWQVMRYRAARWLPATDVRPQSGQWEEAQPPALTDEAGSELALTAAVPQIRFDILGLSEPFLVTWAEDGRTIAIDYQGTGPVRLEKDDG